VKKSESSSIWRKPPSICNLASLSVECNQAGHGLTIAEFFFMNNYDLKIEAPWPEVKSQLQEVNSDLTDEDLFYEKGKEDELLERLSHKLNKSVPEVKGWIESVSHNRGLAR
jgi:hypothetical protein